MPLDFLGCADVEVEVKKKRLLSQFRALRREVELLLCTQKGG